MARGIVAIAMKDVIGIGALNLDLMYEVADLAALRKEGWPLQAGRETSLPAEEFDRLLQELEKGGRLKFRSGGGSAANTVTALARMGFQAGFVGRVGDDEHGAFILREMGGVDLAQIRKGGQSGVCLVVLDRQRDRSLVVQPYVNDAVSFADMDLTALSESRYLHLSAFVGDGPFVAQQRLMEELPVHVQVSLDPGELYARRGMTAILPLIKKTSILFATIDEISTLTGSQDYRAGCREIALLGPAMVVCKRGKEGAYLYSPEEEKEFLPAGETVVVDNTGAGDVYNAGFLAGLLLKRPLDECLAIAHKTAAKSLGGYGRECYPDASDIKELRGD
jgi:sugar/nucleoside kinase (ribokinase family)